jgi:hypothetical protein
MLAPSAYLALAAGSASITQAILPTTVDPSLPTIQTQALVEWKINLWANLLSPPQDFWLPNREPGTP